MTEVVGGGRNKALSFSQSGVGMPAQTEDETIEHPAQLHMAMPLGLSGITLVEDRLDRHPDIIMYFPNRWLSCCVHDNPPWLYHTGELSSDQAG